MPQTNQAQMWKLLMREWNKGPACQFEAASRYTRIFPERTEGWIVLADGLSGMARYREAQAALRKAEKLIARGQRWHVAVQWGHLYREKHDERSAERWYRKALALHRSTETHIFLGATLAKQGRFAEAKKHHRFAIRFARDQKNQADEAHYNLGLILRAERRYAEAVIAFQKALQIDPRYRIAREALKDVEQAIVFRGTSEAG